jgi:hypothetical protein
MTFAAFAGAFPPPEVAGSGWLALASLFVPPFRLELREFSPERKRRQSKAKRHGLRGFAQISLLGKSKKKSVPIREMRGALSP